MDNAKVRVTDSQRFKEMDKHTENWEMIKETEIKTNERTNKQTDKQLDKKPNTNDIESNRNIYSDEDRHACKKMSKQCLKQEKNYFKCL